MKEYTLSYDPGAVDGLGEGFGITAEVHAAHRAETVPSQPELPVVPTRVAETEVFVAKAPREPRELLFELTE